MIAQTSVSERAFEIGCNLPALRINTEDAAPVVSKVDYVNATYALVPPTGPPAVGTLRIRGRGHSTWLEDKKPYRLNFDTAIAPLGMTAMQRNWALIANYFDRSKIHGALAFGLGQQMSGLEWTPQHRTVEVSLNGDFVGVYQLMDLARMEAGRLDLPGGVAGTSGRALTGPYLLEIDKWYIEKGDAGFTTSRGVMVGYDTPDGLNVTQAAYMADWLQDFEDRLFSVLWLDPIEGYGALVDLDSFAAWFWVNEILKCYDSQFGAAAGASCKLYKKRDEEGIPGRLFMGPLWDFDLSWGRNWWEDYEPEGWYTRDADWLARMWDDPAFQAVLSVQWDALAGALDTMGQDAWIDAAISHIGRAADRDSERWPITHGGGGMPRPEFAAPLADEVVYLKDWLAARVAWITAEMA